MPEMNIQQIFEYLPHRYPFLLVDHVSDYDVEAGTISGSKNVSINEYFFQGHFPGHPIMPGVLIIESMAQLAGIVGFKRKGLKPSDGYACYLAGVSEARFKNPVYPGDQLLLRAALTQERAQMLKFGCEASVGTTQTCSAEVTIVGVQT